MPKAPFLSAPTYQPLRYIINGVVASGIHYACLTFALQILALPSAGIANLFAATFGIAVSFVGSRYFVFRVFDETFMQQLSRFILLYSLIAFLQSMLLFAWTDVMKLSFSSGFTVGLFLQVISSYFGNKYLVFRKNETENVV